MNFESARVQLSLIDQRDWTYRISSPKPIQRLVASIKDLGVINPPILVPMGHSAYQIVCGFRRVSACQTLGWKVLNARMLTDKMEGAALLGISIADNAQHRELNSIEQAVAVEKLQGYFNNDDELMIFGAKLGIPLNRDLLKRLRRLNNLSDAVKARIESNILPLTIALELEKLNASAAEAMAAFFEEIRPTLNQQKEILLLVKEIARREEQAIPHVIKTSQINEILADSKIDRPQKLKKVVSILKKWRYPEIQEFEAAVNRHLAALALPGQTKLTIPENFEADTFSMTISFHSQAEFESHIASLAHLAENPHFKAIISKKIDP